MEKKPNKWLFLSLLAFFFGLWELGVRPFRHLQFVLPPPTKIFYTLWEMRERFWFHTLVTLQEMAAGFFLALIAAFPLALIMLHYKTSRTLLQPFFILIQCIPMFTLAPIIVVWLGWGFFAIVIPTALMIFFPLTLNIYQGLRSIPEDLVEFFQSHQATTTQIFFKLRLPWALPHLFAGFRISAAIAGVSAVAGEWAGGQNGLGILMLESRRNTDLEITFAALLCLTALSIFLYLAILWLEKSVLPPYSDSPPIQKWIKKTAMACTKLIPLALLSTLPFFLMSCHAKKPHTTSTRLLLDWLPNPNHVPLYVGVDLGFFKQQGIDLFIQKMHEGGSGMSYLTSKKTDLLINHMPGTLKACERGAPIKWIGVLIKSPLCALIYTDDPSIQKPSDLSGKKFGYCIGLPDIDFLHFLLTSGHITPSETKNVSVDLVASMGTGQVDFTYGGFWNIEPAQLRAMGIETKIFKIEELQVPTYYEMIILTHADSPYASPEFVNRFQIALQKSIDYCKVHPEEAFTCYSKYNPDRSLKTQAWQKEAWTLTYPLLAHDQTIEEEVVKNFYLWQIEQGIIKNPFEYQKLISLK